MIVVGTDNAPSAAAAGERTRRHRTKRRRGRGIKLLLVAGVLAPVLLFGVLAWVVAGDRTLAWERNLVIEFVAYNEAEPLRTATAVLATIGGDYSQVVPFILIAGALGALTVRGHIREAVFVAATVVGVMVLVPILKAGFERPPIGSDPSRAYFPSGHATASASVVGGLIVLFWRTRWRWTAFAGGAAFVLAYGVSLVARASHYPLDVVAGWCVGLAWVSALAFSVQARGLVLGRRGRHGAPPQSS